MKIELGWAVIDKVNNKPYAGYGGITGARLYSSRKKAISCIRSHVVGNRLDENELKKANIEVDELYHVLPISVDIPE